MLYLFLENCSVRSEGSPEPGVNLFGRFIRLNDLLLVFTDGSMQPMAVVRDLLELIFLTLERTQMSSLKFNTKV